MAMDADSPTGKRRRVVPEPHRQSVTCILRATSVDVTRVLERACREARGEGVEEAGVEPVVFRGGLIEQWPARSWTPATLARLPVCLGGALRFDHLTV